VRKAILILAIFGALAVAGASSASVGPPRVTCGSCGGNGGGFTGCANITAAHSASVSVFASIRHYLVVRYCKSYGIITSVSIAAHGCDTSGLVSCSVGPAWQTGGGVGSTSASFEAHAGWKVTTFPIYSNTDVLTLTVPAG
jgi:hypothetical protein